MKNSLRILCVVIMLFTISVAVGCTRTDEIGDILANPAQYEGKQVNLRGYVGNTFWLSILNRGAFELGDGSGTIWIVTDQPPPQKGVQVSVRGNVRPAFTLGDRTLGTVIEETKRN